MLWVSGGGLATPTASAPRPPSPRFYALDIGLGLATGNLILSSTQRKSFYALSVGLRRSPGGNRRKPRRCRSFYALDFGRVLMRITNAIATYLVYRFLCP